MTTRTITGTILDQVGNPISGAGVSFVMNDGVYLLDPDETYMAGGVTALTNSSGVFSVELASGLPITWSVRLPGGDSFVIAVPTGAATTLEELRAAYNGQAPERVPGDPPTVTDFTNMQHPHTSAATGGTLPSLAISTALGFLPGKIFNVTDSAYGASPDATGATNRTAIVNAITAANTAGGGVVHIPAGTYNITGEIGFNTRANITVCGDGMGATVLVGDGGASTEIFNANASSYITLRDMTFDGNTTGNTPVQFVSCDHILVDHVEVKNSAVNGILFDTAGDYCEVRSCIVSDAERGIRASGPIDHLTIVNNKVHNMSESGINVGGSLHVVIANNVLWNDGDDPPDHGFAAIRLTNGGAHISVSGNTIRRFGRGIGYYSIPVELGDPRGEGSDASFTGNTIYDCMKTSILIERAGVSCVGNTIINQRSEAAIYLAGATESVQRCSIVGNTIYDSNGSRMPYGVWENGTSNNNVIAANNIWGYSTAPVLTVGSGTTVFQDYIHLPGRTAGESVFNETGIDMDFRFEGDTATNLLKLDAGLDAVQIGTTTIGALADFRAGTTVFNEPGSDLDFRFEGDTATNLLKLDAGLDAVQIGTTSIGVIADFRASTVVFNEAGNDLDVRFEGDTASNLLVTDAGLDAVMIGTTTAGQIAQFRASTIIFNENAGDIDLRVEGTSDVQLLSVDAGLNMVGIGAVPATKFDVNSDSIRVRTAKTPATAGATGIQGQIAWDADYLYVCTATNVWRRVAHATW